MNFYEKCFLRCISEGVLIIRLGSVRDRFLTFLGGFWSTGEQCDKPHSQQDWSHFHPVSPIAIILLCAENSAPKNRRSIQSIRCGLEAIGKYHFRAY